jgi:hypothetical protein
MMDPRERTILDRVIEKADPNSRLLPRCPDFRELEIDAMLDMVMEAMPDDIAYQCGYYDEDEWF